MHVNYPGLLIEILKDLEKEKGYNAGSRSAAFYIDHIDRMIKELKEKLAKFV